MEKKKRHESRFLEALLVRCETVSLQTNFEIKSWRLFLAKKLYSVGLCFTVLNKCGHAKVGVTKQSFPLEQEIFPSFFMKSSPFFF